MSIANYKAAALVSVDAFFKKRSSYDWNLIAFVEWRKKIDPFIKFETCKTDFDASLDIIRNCELILREDKTLIPDLTKYCKVIYYWI